MRPRYSSSYGGGRPRRRWAVFSLAALAVLGAAVWIAPTVLVLTDLRDRPLEAALRGIDGRVTSRSAAWTWFDGIEYRDVAVFDRGGRPVLVVPRMVIDRGLVSLAFDPTNLGTVRLIGGESLVEVRRGGSNIEDTLAPWLATLAQAEAAPVSFDLEVVDGAVELVDLERQDAWRITDLIAAGAVRPDEAIGGWSVSGRLMHAGDPVRDLTAALTRPAPAGGSSRPPRLDRTTIVAGATATLARDGGWSVSSPGAPDGDAPRTLAVAGNRVPLGVSSVWATRFDLPQLLDGLADIRLDIALPADGIDASPSQKPQPRRPRERGLQLEGVLSATQLAVCRCDTLAEVVAIDRLEVPLDLSFDGRRIVVRRLEAKSPLFKAEASGSIGLPREGPWEWAESLVGDDFALAVDVDLTAAARAMPGGLAVRPDVRVTAGQLQLAAAAHADGSERVLEVRASSRDLAAVQGERQLRWNEPFTAWVRGRRGPANGDRIRIEEARIASPAVELSAMGTSESSSVQWTIDIGSFVREAAEVIDLAHVTLAGTARGRLGWESPGNDGPATATLSASLSNFEFAAPGLLAWKDEELSLEAQASGSLSDGAAVVDTARAVIAAGEDRLEATLTGAALVNPAAILPGIGSDAAAAWLRPAPQSDGVSADWSLSGDLRRWQPRLAVLSRGPWGPAGMKLGGKLQASAALVASGAAWQIRRAGAEIEKFTAEFDSRIVSEPRVVATAAGLVDPSTGRIEVSSAEILTATLSLRTGGFELGPAAPDAARDGTVFALIERLRGRAQWQADIGRLEKWLVAAPEAARWPAGGRAWGTVEIIDTPAGPNLLVDATGNQLTLSHRPDAAVAGAEPRQVWAEPRAKLVLEVTRAAGGQAAAGPADRSAGGPASATDGMTINRLAVESSTIAVSAAGRIAEWSSRRLVELGGTVVYDWPLLSRLLTPWTGGRLQVAGGGARPFAVRAPLGAVAEAVLGGSGPKAPPATAQTNAEATTAGQPPQESLPLPDDWLSAVRGRGGDTETGRLARVTLPAAPPRQTTGQLATEWLRALSVETSAAWTAADVDGFQVEAGEMAVRLFEGQLAIGPFEIAASGGRLRGAPWLKLLPLPGELIVPPGRAVDRVALSNRFCDQWISWVAPLIGKSTRTQGVVSVDLAGARVPLADPFAGELSGQLIFENLEVAPGPQMQPLANLIVKLQSVIDPRFAFGDKAVLLRVRHDPVRIRLAERRLWHEGLVMDMGQLVVRSGGSVGADGTLAMTAEVAFRGDLAGSTPVIAPLLRTPIVIPLRGTVHRPQFDAGAIDKIVGRIVENTAEAVINDGLGRGLEQLFGNPQPPAPPR